MLHSPCHSPSPCSSAASITPEVSSLLRLNTGLPVIDASPMISNVFSSHIHENSYHSGFQFSLQYHILLGLIISISIKVNGLILVQAKPKADHAQADFRSLFIIIRSNAKVDAEVELQYWKLTNNANENSLNKFLHYWSPWFVQTTFTVEPVCGVENVTNMDWLINDTYVTTLFIGCYYSFSISSGRTLFLSEFPVYW